MEQKHIIIILLIVVVVLAAAMAVMILSPFDAKADTKLTIKSNDTLHEGDKFKVKLTDINGTGISNQTVNVTLKDSDGQTSYFSVVTNSKGIGTLKLDKSAGNYTVNCTYGGNDKYTGNTTFQKLTIEEIVEEPAYEESTVSSSNSGSNSDDGYWETSMDADFEYHTEYESDGEFRQYDRSGRLVGSSHDEDQVEVANNVGWRI